MAANPDPHRTATARRLKRPSLTRSRSRDNSAATYALLVLGQNLDAVRGVARRLWRSRVSSWRMILPWRNRWRIVMRR